MGHFELLRSLYLGQASNADLLSTENRRRLHVSTPLDALVPELLGRGLDVVLTGNPGDGKSHLVRHLVDEDAVPGVAVELDLSAVPTADVIERWTQARSSGKRFLLCANQGPLKTMLGELADHPDLGLVAAELTAQLRRLVVSRPEELPAEPRDAALVDLADRDVLDPALVRQAIRHAADEDFLPDGEDFLDLPAGQNILLLAERAGAADSLARLIGVAGRHVAEHVTFRVLWGTISFAICRGRSAEQQARMLRQGEVGLGTYPLDFLVAPRGQGPLLRAIRDHGDPARHPTPALDEQIWALGEPVEGQWYEDVERGTAPATLWDEGKQDVAITQFARIKRLAILAHEAGELILERMEADTFGLPSAVREDAELLALLTSGVRRCYLSPTEEPAAPPWLLSGIPLWVGHSYRDKMAMERPHVAAAFAAAEDFAIDRPIRAPWLGVGLGRAPEVAWLRHAPSGIALRVDPAVLVALRRAASTAGPLDPPQPVQRFLARLAGWAEARARSGDARRFAVLERPRGELVVAAAVQPGPEGASYARS